MLRLRFLNLRRGKVPVSLYLLMINLAVVILRPSYSMAWPMGMPFLRTSLTSSIRFFMVKGVLLWGFWSIFFCCRVIRLWEGYSS